ncbi:MAG: hypothetical protein Kow0027_07570 [Saprospiraceae bacterium]
MEEVTRTEKENKRKGLIFSVVFHTLIIFIAAFYGFKYQVPPPEPGGILVNLGIPDVGQGTENAAESSPAEPVKEVAEKPQEEATPPPKPQPKAEEKPVQKEVKTTEDPAAAALKKKQQEEARKKAEEERKRKEAEAEANRKAEEERKRKEAEAQRLKDQIAGGLSGSGKGKGNTGKPGNQGDPSGDPNASALEGISSGAGVVGGGLSGRGVMRKGPPIKDNSQEQGTVVLEVCVDRSGKVISAEYLLKGSTTADPKLISLAKQNAFAWRFSEGNVDKQCGTIRYEFRLK